MTTRLLALLCACSVALSGCAGHAPLNLLFTPNAPKTITLPKLPCSKPDSWTKEEFQGLAKSLEPLKDDPLVTKETLEWSRLRLEAKACQATQ